MNITYKERQELNALSKEVFGVSSKWRTMLKGAVKPAKDELGKVIMPYKVGHKGNYVRHTRWEVPTLEAVRKQILDIKAKQAEMLAEMKTKVDATDSKA